MSALFSTGVKTGVWTNYDHGRIFGATLTLSARKGNYLIAFLAMFVSIAGTQLWVIARFILHQVNTRRHKSQNGLYAQQQLVLRNSEGEALNTAWRLFQVSWAWRDMEPKSIVRSLHIILLALLVLATFSVGGIFSSEVSKAAGSAVVVKSSQCGVLAGLIDMLAGLVAIGESPSYLDTVSKGFNLFSQVTSAWTYAQACYGPQTNEVQCSLYVKEQLNWMTIVNASCPYDDNLCILNGTRSLQLDTGLIDSGKDLGINFPPGDRINYRKVSTCAPIYSEKFNKFHQSLSISNSTWPYNSTISDANWGKQGPFQDFYFAIEDYTTMPTYEYNIQDSYNIQGAFSNSAANDWTPVTKLNRTDAEITLFFLAANTASYVSPVDDPWFSAHRQFNEVDRFSGEETDIVTGFQSDAYVHVLACSDQYQICNPSTNQCSPLDRIQSTIRHLQDIRLNGNQNQTAFLIMSFIAPFFNSGSFVNALKSESLLAARQQIDGMSLPLPNNQWMLEVSSWFAASLGGLQQAVVEYATGPSPDHLMHGKTPGLVKIGDPSLPATKALCNNQMVRSSREYQNFSVLGISCIIAIGGTIILVSLNVELLVGFVQRKINRGEEGRSHWIADSNFQVQRVMYEGRGYRKWRGQNDTVPVYFGGDLRMQRCGGRSSRGPGESLFGDV